MSTAPHFEINGSRLFTSWLAAQSSSIAFTTYQVGTLITTGAFGQGFIYGLIACIALVAVLIYTMRQGDNKAEQNLQLHNA